MQQLIVRTCGLLLLILSIGCASDIYNVRDFGAKGDGVTLDTPAINRAIQKACNDGGGTVHFPHGTYLCYSIHLLSNVSLYLENGATILAADSPDADAMDKYDPPEPNRWDKYQDFGHSHWHNSLIWGENLQNVSILGPGTIDGKGLNVGSSANRLFTGTGNKAIALKLCRNVTLRDITIFRGGHFAILATGVDNLTIDNLKIDTNRDGMDIDCCKNVRVSNCTVNSPNDDGICPKSSYALGYAKATEDMTITNCQVSGYVLGTLLDGTFQRKPNNELFSEPPTGRIKLGTESNGGFKNITISNCVFSCCRGIALETVDGGDLEDITISNITMRDITSSVIFLRLGDRARGPHDPPAGHLRRIHIDNLIASNCDPLYSSIVSGIPGHDVEDVRLSNIRIVYQGGGRRELATSQPSENESKYPEPSMFGTTPAYGFFIRHASGIELSNINLNYTSDDFRPPFIVQDAKNVQFDGIEAQHAGDVPTLMLHNVKNIDVDRINGLSDFRADEVKEQKY
jgi:polygalacturonase